MIAYFFQYVLVFCGTCSFFIVFCDLLPVGRRDRMVVEFITSYVVSAYHH